MALTWKRRSHTPSRVIWLVAMIYPEPEKGGRGKKGKLVKSSRVWRSA
jgi:hypothetical protein